jgi:NAD(P)-dependent dehydrogenase (short-subunit alcohol dehydrogenase family)
MPAFDLKGRIAFVTGASSGLGRHFAKVLAEAGAAVAISARRVEGCRRLAPRSLNTVSDARLWRSM